MLEKEDMEEAGLREEDTEDSVRWRELIDCGVPSRRRYCNFVDELYLYLYGWLFLFQDSLNWDGNIPSDESLHTVIFWLGLLKKESNIQLIYIYIFHII